MNCTPNVGQKTAFCKIRKYSEKKVELHIREMIFLKVCRIFFRLLSRSNDNGHHDKRPAFVGYLFQEIQAGEHLMGTNSTMETGYSAFTTFFKSEGRAVCLPESAFFNKYVP